MVSFGSGSNLGIGKAIRDSGLSAFISVEVSPLNLQVGLTAVESTEGRESGFKCCIS